jgi:hypothetical protein
MAMRDDERIDDELLALLHARSVEVAEVLAANALLPELPDDPGDEESQPPQDEEPSEDATPPTRSLRGREASRTPTSRSWDEPTAPQGS